MNKLSSLLLAMAMAFPLAACDVDNDGPEDAIEDAADGLGDAAEETGDAVEEGADNLN